jgi:hypothetical protein
MDVISYKIDSALDYRSLVKLSALDRGSAAMCGASLLKSNNDELIAP